VYKEEGLYSETEEDDSKSSRGNGVITRGVRSREEELEK
jgi:hypothetical protein